MTDDLHPNVLPSHNALSPLEPVEMRRSEVPLAPLLRAVGAIAPPRLVVRAASYPAVLRRVDVA